MKIKWLGFGITLAGSYLIYIKRNLDDDSLLVGSCLILIGILIVIIGWTALLDSKRK